MCEERDLVFPKRNETLDYISCARNHTIPLKNLLNHVRKFSLSCGSFDYKVFIPRLISLSSLIRHTTDGPETKRITSIMALCNPLFPRGHERHQEMEVNLEARTDESVLNVKLKYIKEFGLQYPPGEKAELMVIRMTYKLPTELMCEDTGDINFVGQNGIWKLSARGDEELQWNLGRCNDSIFNTGFDLEKISGFTQRRILFYLNFSNPLPSIIFEELYWLRFIHNGHHFWSALITKKNAPVFLSSSRVPKRITFSKSDVADMELVHVSYSFNKSLFIQLDSSGEMYWAALIEIDSRRTSFTTLDSNSWIKFDYIVPISVPSEMAARNIAETFLHLQE
ncbi:hypothetical protein ROZALSC1DRAFT_27426 [Rozella allomycis CSF55]|uniref:Uncharacterized protein n=1 Tax=Rozella allomycis (strain CSF55) TaxID=988480 RepID=A0A4P9YQ14_ROZAC|nr:hypothetical protein ROZALSC1DRAFT_27426 [Rozella allomycis CSF55]